MLQRKAGVLVICAVAACNDGSSTGEPPDRSVPVTAPEPAPSQPSTTPTTVPFLPAGNEWVASAGTLDARHDGTQLKLTPLPDERGVASTPTPLLLQTARVAVGTTELAIGKTPVATKAGALEIASRDLVETVETRYSDVEQTWSFAQRPLATGDLVVEVAVAGESYRTRTTDGMHFAGPDGLGFVYGNGRWIDADGNDVDVPAEWHGDRIVLRVSQDVLARSAFPARLDPTISAETAVDAPIAGSPTGFASVPGDVAFSGAQYLAVWRDTRIDAGDIYATRLSTTGAVLDTTSLAIAKETGLQATPAAAFVNGQYLVVWENRATNDLEAARVSTSGTVTSLGAIAVSGDIERKPRIAVLGSEALIVYQTGDDVRAVRYTSSGTFSAEFSIATTSDTERDPVVAANPAGNYLVVWSDGVAGATTPTYSIAGQQVTPAGALSGAAFQIATGQSLELTPAAGFLGGNYIVAWNKNWHGTFVYGTRVTPAGAVLDTHTETVYGTTTTATYGGRLLSTSRAAAYPSLACTSASCLVAWRDRRTFATTAYDVYSQLLDSTLAASGAEAAVSTQARNEEAPRVSAAGTGYFVIWPDTRNGDAQLAYGSRVSSAGAVSDPNGILLARGNNMESTPTAARSSTTWLVGWSDSRVAGNNLLAARFSNAFAVNDNPAVNVSNAPATQASPAVATDSATGNYMVVWTDNRNVPTRDIYAARMPQSGAVLDTNGFAVTTAAADQLVPDIAAGSAGKFLVVWQDRRNGVSTQFDIYGAIIDNTGAVIVPEFPISTAPYDQAAPHVAYSSVDDVFLVVWADQRALTDRDIYGARVTPTGTVLDPSGFAIANTSTLEVEPDVAFGSDRFLVAWRNSNDLHGARVHASATAITRDDASDLVITSVAGRESTPRVAWVNDSNHDFAIVWVDSRAYASNSYDIYGTTVVQDTGAIGTEYVVSNTIESETHPALSKGARLNGTSMELVATYSTYVTSSSTYRVENRKLGFATAAVLQSITVTPANTTIAKGASQAYTATGNYSDGSTQNLTTSVTWASSTAAGTITSGGVATGVAQGTTTISATLGSIVGSTNLTIGPAVLVSISVSPTFPSIAKGTTQALTATATFSDGTQQDETTAVTWASSSTATATITAGGVATGVAAGTTTISATLGSLSDSTTLTVTSAVLADLVISPVTPQIAKSTTLQFTATGVFSDGSTQDLTSSATWGTTASGIATISSAGLATGIAAGTTTISAAFGGFSDSTTLTVTTATLSSIAVTPANQTIAKNTTLQYTATGTFSDGTTQDITQQATWSSSNTARATVSNASGTKGLATGVSAGTANIRAALLGKTGQTQLTVSNATLVSITVTPANPTVAKTFKVQLTATGTFSDGTTQVLTGVAWTSSNTAIATVNASGLATGKAAGTATITATKTGVSASTLLTVTSATLSSIAVTPATLTLASGQSSQLAATGTFSDGTTLDLTTQVSWTSSSKKTVSVNGSGRIKANKTGTATISAAKTGTTGTAVITVP